MRKGIMALEAIHFQGDSFFKELTEAVAAVSRMQIPSRSEAGLIAFYESKEMLEIIKVIEHYTKISLFYKKDYYNTGPACIVPLFNKNHIIFNTSDRKTAGDELERDAKSLLIHLNKPMLAGSVDLRNNTISGDYCEMEFILALPVNLFFGACDLKADEYAAIILHEVGHVFTTFEFISRTLTTNQVLAATSAALRTKDPEIISAVFTSAEKIMGMTKEQAIAFNTAKDDKSVAVILLASAIDKSISELGKSVYDSVSCEQLADQYAARCGAGKSLVIGLDKIIPLEYKNPRTSGYDAALYVILAIGVYVFPILLVLLVLSLVGYVSHSVTDGLFASKEDATYDNFPSRLKRVKDQLIQRLKDPALNSIEKEKLIKDIAEIEAITSKSHTDLLFFEKIAYLLKPSYRNAHKYEILQKELETLSNNSLFIQAAKLSTL